MSLGKPDNWLIYPIGLYDVISKMTNCQGVQQHLFGLSICLEAGTSKDLDHLGNIMYMYL